MLALANPPLPKAHLGLRPPIRAEVKARESELSSKFNPALTVDFFKGAVQLFKTVIVRRLIQYITPNYYIIIYSVMVYVLQYSTTMDYYVG